MRSSASCPLVGGLYQVSEVTVGQPLQPPKRTLTQKVKGTSTTAAPHNHISKNSCLENAFFFSMCLIITPSCHIHPLSTYLHEQPWLCNVLQPLPGQGSGRTFSFPLGRGHTVPGVSTQSGDSLICRRKEALKHAIQVRCSYLLEVVREAFLHLPRLTLT